MLRMCVLTVFTDTDSSAAISARQVRRQVPQHLQLTLADSSPWAAPGWSSAASDLPRKTSDVGQQRGVRRLVPGQRPSSSREPVIANGSTSRSASASASACSAA